MTPDPLPLPLPPLPLPPPPPVVVVPTLPDLQLPGVVFKLLGGYPREETRTYQLDPAGARTATVNVCAVAGLLSLPGPPDAYPLFPNDYTLFMGGDLYPVPIAEITVGDYLHDETAGYPYTGLRPVFTAGVTDWPFLFYVRNYVYRREVARIPAGAYSVRIGLLLTDAVGLVANYTRYTLPAVQIAG